jgi:hypothetical protein
MWSTGHETIMETDNDQTRVLRLRPLDYKPNLSTVIAPLSQEG